MNGEPKHYSMPNFDKPKQTKMENVSKNLQLIEKLAEIGQETKNRDACYVGKDLDIKTDVFSLIRLIASNINGKYRATTGINLVLWED